MGLYNLIKLFKIENYLLKIWKKLKLKNVIIILAVF